MTLDFVVYNDGNKKNKNNTLNLLISIVGHCIRCC